MNNKNTGEKNQENADLICAKINQEADEECNVILERARKEAEKILMSARLEADEKKQRILKDADIEIQESVEKIKSSLNLEKKRLFLEEKDTFIHSVFAAVKQKLEEFRADNGYLRFLENAILECLKVIGEINFVVSYSYLDENIFNDAFMKRIEKICQDVEKMDCHISFKKADFRDSGVIVNSSDGRIMYDNRLSARLERAKDRIYQQLLKEDL